jgi:carboxypeptidase-like protein
MRRLVIRLHIFSALAAAASLFALLLATRALGAQASASIGASILGDVISSRDSLPVSGAQIRLPADDRAVVSDSLGRFRVAGLLAGTHALLVRRLGYSPASALLTVGAMESLYVSVVLDERSHELDDVVTRATRTPMKAARQEFEQRRHIGVGKFVDGRELAEMTGEPLRLAIQRHVPGVAPVYDPTSSAYYLASKRGPAGRALKSTTPCYVQIYLDGTRVAEPDQGNPWHIDQVPPEMLEGLEYYDAATTPVRYRGNGSDCGTLLLWTK